MNPKVVFFFKDKNNDKHLVRLPNKKQRQNFTKIRNKGKDITTDFTEIKKTYKGTLYIMLCLQIR